MMDLTRAVHATSILGIVYSDYWKGIKPNRHSNGSEHEQRV